MPFKSKKEGELKLAPTQTSNTETAADQNNENY